MLDQLRQIAIFAKTVECGSFVKAAATLELSPSVVSHHIAQLEKQLGIALIYRSTRKLSLTSDGERLLEAAQKMAGSAEEFINLAVNNDAQLMGSIHITLPAFMAKSVITKQLGDFVKLNPNINMRLDFTDTRREVIQDGIDLAIRAQPGSLSDSNLKARKLYTIERCVVASSGLAKRLSSYKTPTDLEKEPWISFSAVGLRYSFTHKTGKQVTINARSQLVINNLYAVLELIKNGNGIGVLPAFIANEEKANNSLVTLLKSWHLAPINVYAIWPPNTPKDGLTKKLVTFLCNKTAYN
jgi:DNA-binding transcriptional LysR family regulator